MIVCNSAISETENVDTVAHICDTELVRFIDRFYFISNSLDFLCCIVIRGGGIGAVIFPYRMEVAQLQANCANMQRVLARIPPEVIAQARTSPARTTLHSKEAM